MKCKTIFSLILLASCTCSMDAKNAWSYIGIPYVTDEVPDEIMPKLPNDPTGNGNSWPGYDPCTIATPTFVDGTTQYYVDTVNGDDGTAGNSGRGSVANPRQTLPGLSADRWTLGTGDQVFITGNSTVFADNGNYVGFASGTSENPAWIIGVGGQPNFVQSRINWGGTHLIADNIRMVASGGTRWKFGNGTDSVYFQYGTLRNSLVDGLGSTVSTATLGGRGLGLGEETKFICLYNNVIRNLGQWNQQDNQGKDQHAIQFTSWVHYVWIIDNEIYHCEGDSVQTNTSNQNHFSYGARPHYHYIAGNTMYENYENAIDNKNGYHIIASENLIHSFRNDFKAANNVAFILANDGEGWLSGYEWAIFNTIYNAGTGIKFAPTASLTVDDPGGSPVLQTAGQKTFAIGNLIYDVDTGINLDVRGDGPDGIMTRTWFGEMWVVNNTISAGVRPIIQRRSNRHTGETSLVTVTGNLLWNDGTGTPDTDLEMNDNNVQTTTASYNLVSRSSGSSDIKKGELDVNTGNVFDKAVSFIDSGANNYAIQSGSPARDIPGFSSTPDPYTTFQTLYGIDIRKDLSGNNRPANNLWDAGAYEFGANTTTEALLAPGNLKVVSLE